VVDAKKSRYGGKQALALLDGVRTLLVAKGRKVTRIDLRSADRPDDATLAALLLGPTGNLRAPAMKAGTTMLVGFSPEMYEEALG
jgi:arsenate reductase-like glutaredoxin family protein